MTAEDIKFIVHPEPVWRDRANFIIRAELPESDRPYRFEQLWSRRYEGNRQFEICCIPFFVFELALGDIVTTFADQAREHTVESVARPSGRSVFRARFGAASMAQETVAKRLLDMGALLEWSSATLVAIDAGSADVARTVARFLAAEESGGSLIWETGKSAGAVD